MPPSVVVVIRENPLKTHRAVEALRIALGLGAGENPLTVVLVGQAPLLLTDDPDDIVDQDILEKYLPSFQQLKIPFLIPEGGRRKFEIDPAFEVREASSVEIAELIALSDRTLAF
ncbi:MAG: hypothetical protein AB1411_10025 [Nitrospirota bacterium]